MIYILPLWTFYICSNIPAEPGYGVYLSQLIRYSRACGYYQNFLDRGLLLTRKLLNQSFLVAKKKFPHGYFPFVVIAMPSFLYSWLITEFVASAARLLLLVEQNLLNLSLNLCSSPVLVGFIFQSLVFCLVLKMDGCLSFCPYSFGHCLSSASDYLFGIF